MLRGPVPKKMDHQKKKSEKNNKKANKKKKTKQIGKTQIVRFKAPCEESEAPDACLALSEIKQQSLGVTCASESVILSKRQKYVTQKNAK